MEFNSPQHPTTSLPLQFSPFSTLLPIYINPTSIPSLPHSLTHIHIQPRSSQLLHTSSAMATTTLKIATILLLCMIVSQPFAAQAAITCGTVATALRPCISYLQKGGAVPGGCCSGVRSLIASAATTKDRQTACTCMKSAASSIRGIDLKNAAGLPRACNVNIPYAISPSTNCANVK